MRFPLRRAPGYLIGSILALALLPAAGAVVRWNGLPPGFFEVFPAARAGQGKPPFSAAHFVAGAALALLITAFFVAPGLFGFRQRGSKGGATGAAVRRKALPSWFWLGLAVSLAAWAAHWWGQELLPFAEYAFLPLWWGYIFVLDGIVCFRTGGRSLFATRKIRLLTIAVVSIPAWAFFEILNYAVIELWIYPNTQVLSPLEHALWHLLCFSVVLPAVFEWYALLQTFEGASNRWRRGPVIRIPQSWIPAILLVGLLSMFLLGAAPFELFFLLWVGPLLVLGAALAACKLWTPFSPIAEGNWSPVMLAALAAAANGFFWEFWNFGSARFQGSRAINPNYWVYDIPYVDRFHLFSEMPALGYFGYLPFGVVAWLCWLVAAQLLGVDPAFALTADVPEARRRVA